MMPVGGRRCGPVTGTQDLACTVVSAALEGRHAAHVYLSAPLT